MERQTNFETYTVESNREIAPNVYLLSFRRRFKFMAGQVVAIKLHPSHDARLYSIASGENDEMLSILYDKKPEGFLTPPLSVLKPGDSVLCSPPSGTFLSGKEEAFWIASGTGIAPFHAMAKSGLAVNKTLIHGGRKRDNFYFSDFFGHLLQEKYVRCASIDEGDGLYPGRLTAYLRDQQLNPELTYYLCGSSEMVVDTRDLLVSKGVPYNNIISEIYF